MHRQPWLALVPTGESRALEAARSQAGARPIFALPKLANPLDPASLMEAARMAAANDARELVVAISARLVPPSGRPWPLRLFALEEALREWDLGPLWTPLLHHTWPELGRLARALGVAKDSSWDCPQSDACGECAGCTGNRRAWGAGAPAAQTKGE